MRSEGRGERRQTKDEDGVRREQGRSKKKDKRHTKTSCLASWKKIAVDFFRTIRHTVGFISACFALKRVSKEGVDGPAFIQQFCLNPPLAFDYVATSPCVSASYSLHCLVLTTNYMRQREKRTKKVQKNVCAGQSKRANAIRPSFFLLSSHIYHT